MKKEVQPMPKLMLIKALKDFFQTGAYGVVVLIETEILPVMRTIAVFNKGSTDPNRGKTYFLELVKKPEQKDEYEKIGNSFLRFVLECIEIWAKIKPNYYLTDIDLPAYPSEFTKLYNELLNDEKVTFCDKPSYFKEGDVARIRQHFRIKSENILDDAAGYVEYYSVILEQSLENNISAPQMQTLRRLLRLPDIMLVEDITRILIDCMLSKQSSNKSKCNALDFLNEIMQDGVLETIYQVSALCLQVEKIVSQIDSKETSLKRGQKLFKTDPELSSKFYNQLLRMISIWSDIIPKDPLGSAKDSYFKQVFERMGKTYEFPFVSDTNLKKFAATYTANMKLLAPINREIAQRLKEQEAERQKEKKAAAAAAQAKGGEVPKRPSQKDIQPGPKVPKSMADQTLTQRFVTLDKIFAHFAAMKNMDDHDWLDQATDYVEEFNKTFEEYMESNIEMSDFEEMMERGYEYVDVNTKIIKCIDTKGKSDEDKLKEIRMMVQQLNRTPDAEMKKIQEPAPSQKSIKGEQQLKLKEDEQRRQHDHRKQQEELKKQEELKRQQDLKRQQSLKKQEEQKRRLDEQNRKQQQAKKKQQQLKRQEEERRKQQELIRKQKEQQKKRQEQAIKRQEEQKRREHEQRQLQIKRQEELRVLQEKRKLEQKKRAEDLMREQQRVKQQKLQQERQLQQRMQAERARQRKRIQQEQRKAKEAAIKRQEQEMMREYEKIEEEKMKKKAGKYSISLSQGMQPSNLFETGKSGSQIGQQKKSQQSSELPLNEIRPVSPMAHKVQAGRSSNNTSMIQAGLAIYSSIPPQSSEREKRQISQTMNQVISVPESIPSHPDSGMTAKFKQQSRVHQGSSFNQPPPQPPANTNGIHSFATKSKKNEVPSELNYRPPSHTEIGEQNFSSKVDQSQGNPRNIHISERIDFNPAQRGSKPQTPHSFKTPVMEQVFMENQFTNRSGKPQTPRPQTPERLIGRQETPFRKPSFDEWSEIMQPELQPLNHSFYNNEQKRPSTAAQLSFKNVFQTDKFLLPSKTISGRQKIFWLQQDTQILNQSRMRADSVRASTSQGFYPKATNQFHQSFVTLPEVLAERSEKFDGQLKILKQRHRHQVEVLEERIKKLQRELKEKDRTINDQRQQIMTMREGSISGRGGLTHSIGMTPQRAEYLQQQNQLLKQRLKKNSSYTEKNSKYEPSWSAGTLTPSSSQALMINKIKNALKQPRGRMFIMSAYDPYLGDLISDARSKKLMLKNKQLLFQNMVLEVGAIISHDNTLKVALFIQSQSPVQNFKINLVAKDGSQPMNTFKVSSYPKQFTSTIFPGKQQKLIYSFQNPVDVPFSVPYLSITYRVDSEDKEATVLMPCAFNRFVNYYEAPVEEFKRLFKSCRDEVVYNTPLIFYNRRILKDHTALEQFIPKVKLLNAHKAGLYEQGRADMKYGVRVHYKQAVYLIRACFKSNHSVLWQGAVLAVQNSDTPLAYSNASKALEFLLATLACLLSVDKPSRA